jgi:hypothetical protein
VALAMLPLPLSKHMTLMLLLPQDQLEGFCRAAGAGRSRSMQCERRRNRPVLTQHRDLLLVSSAVMHPLKHESIVNILSRAVFFPLDSKCLLFGDALRVFVCQGKRGFKKQNPPKNRFCIGLLYVRSSLCFGGKLLLKKAKKDNKKGQDSKINIQHEKKLREWSKAGCKLGMNVLMY